MKKLSLSFFLLLFSLVCLSQPLSSRLNISAGFAIPNGSFGSSGSSINSGFAETGRNLTLGIQVPINKSISGIFSYSNNSFFVDREGYEAVQSEIFKTDFTNQNLIVTNQFTLNSNLEKYNNHNFSAGIRFALRLSDDLNFFLTPKVNYSFLKVPDVGIAVKDSIFEFGSSQKVNISKEFNPGIDFGITYQLSKQIQLFTLMDYLYSEHSPTYTLNAGLLGGNRIQSTFERNVDFSTLAISIGISISFDPAKEKDD